MKTDLQIILGFSLSLISHSQSAAKPRQSCCTTLSLIPIPTLLSMAAVSLIRFLACLPALVSHLSSSVASSTLQTGLSSSMPGTKQWLKSMFVDPESLIFSSIWFRTLKVSCYPYTWRLNSLACPWTPSPVWPGSASLPPSWSFHLAKLRDRLWCFPAPSPLFTLPFLIATPFPPNTYYLLCRKQLQCHQLLEVVPDPTSRIPPLLSEERALFCSLSLSPFGNSCHLSTHHSRLYIFWDQHLCLYCNIICKMHIHLTAM